jgi:uncharacterized membrane protein/DNA-binding MarR family transcriptional regulator
MDNDPGRGNRKRRSPMRKISALAITSMFFLSLVSVLLTPATAVPTLAREARAGDPFYEWTPVTEVEAGLVEDPAVLVTHGQEVIVLWKDEGLHFARMSKAGALRTSGTLVETVEDRSAALDGDQIVVVWTSDRRLMFQRFDLDGGALGLERTISVDSSGVSSPSVSVASDGTVHVSYITFMHGSPRATFVALNGDGTTLISNRIVDLDGKDASWATIRTGDGDTPYMLVTTTSGTRLAAISKYGTVDWDIMLYNDGNGVSPDLSIRNGIIVPTWRTGTDLNWLVLNGQGSMIAADSVSYDGMQGIVRSGLDSQGLVHAIVNDGHSLVHLAMRTGEGVVVEETVATGIGTSIEHDMAVDGFDVVYNVHAFSSLFYCHGKTYSFEIVSTDFSAFEAVHPDQTSIGTMVLANRGGLVDAIGVEASVFPSTTGWTVDVSEDEVYLSANGENEAQITLIAPETGHDGDTVSLSISIKALSMPSRSFEMEVPVTMAVEYGLSLDTDQAFKTLPPGFSEDFTITIANEGEVEESIYLFATADPGEGGVKPGGDDGRSDDWSVSLSEDHVTLGPDTNGEVTLKVSAPVWAGEGQLTTIELIGLVEQDQMTSSKVNLYAMAMSEVDIVLGIKPKDGNIWRTVLPGGEAEFEVDVRNDGRSDSTVTVNLEVVSGIGDWDAYLAMSSLRLKGGDSMTVPLTVSAPEDALAGQRFVVRVRATSDRGLSEAHVDAITFVGKVSDLSVTQVDRYAEADPGKEAHYTFTVKNEGNAGEVFLFFSDTPFGWEPARFEVGGVPVGGYALDVGRTATVDAFIKVPKVTSSGDHKAMLQVIDGDNVEMPITVHVNMVSDIWISAAETVREAVDGEASFNFRVKNYGNGPDEVQFIPEGLPDGWRVELPDTPGGFMSLAQGKELLMAMDVVIPDEVQEGDFEFGLRALPLRGDGALVRLLVKVIASDLEIVGVDFSTNTFVQGDIEAVTLTVRNNGPGMAGRVVILAEDNGRAFGQDELYVIRAGADASVTFTWAVEEGTHKLRFTVDPSNRIYERDEDNNIEEIKVIATLRTTPSSQLPTEAIAGATFTISLALIGTVAATTEWGKFKFVWWFWVPLYTKLKRTGVLDHFVRGQVYGYIKANPGEHYNAIKKALDMKNGTLVYHLQTLEREEYIKSASDGRYKRFYPAGMKVPDEPTRKLNKIQEIILRLIGESPGISQKEIAEEIGLSSATINYHINVMIKAKVIRLEKIGRTTHCYVLDDEEGPEPVAEAEDQVEERAEDQVEDRIE